MAAVSKRRMPGPNRTGRKPAPSQLRPLGLAEATLRPHRDHQRARAPAAAAPRRPRPPASARPAATRARKVLQILRRRHLGGPGCPALLEGLQGPAPQPRQVAVPHAGRHAVARSLASGMTRVAPSSVAFSTSAREPFAIAGADGEHQRRGRTAPAPPAPPAPRPPPLPHHRAYPHVRPAPSTSRTGSASAPRRTRR